jgi:hypothetical protein
MSDTKVSRWGGALFDALHWRTLREPLVPVFAILLLLASLVPWFAFRPLFSDFSAQLAWRPWRADLRFLAPAIPGWVFLPFFLFQRLCGHSFLSAGERLGVTRAFRVTSLGVIAFLILDTLLSLLYAESLWHPATWLVPPLDFLGAAIVALLVQTADWLTAVRFEEFLELGKSAGAMPPPEIGAATSFKLVDSVDFRILRLVDRSGGDAGQLHTSGEAIASPPMFVARLKKLVAFGYVEYVRSLTMDRFFLTPQGLDLLGLPSSLFAITITDERTIRRLAACRSLLAQERHAEVVVECAKLLEETLRAELHRAHPEVGQVGGKPLERATLGELIGEARRRELTGRFEDQVLGAINSRRSQRVVHAGDEGAPPPTVDDGYFVFTLTEVALRALSSRLAGA